MLNLVRIALLASASAGIVLAAAPPGHEGFGGIWVLNRDRGDAPGVPNVPEAGTSDGGTRGGGRFGGRGGRGGFGGRGGGRDGSDSENAAARRQAMASYVRATMEASRQLTIVVHEDSVSVTSAEGIVLLLKTDAKKIEERAANGLVKVNRKAYWDRDRLVHEIEIDNGPRIVRSYELSPGGTQLQLTTNVQNARGGPMNLVRVYERPVDPVSR